MLVKCGRPPPARPIQSSNSIMSNAFRSSPFFWQRPFPFRIVFMRFIAIFAAAAAAVVVVVIAVVVVVIAVVVVVGGGGVVDFFSPISLFLYFSFSFFLSTGVLLPFQSSQEINRRSK